MRLEIDSQPAKLGIITHNARTDWKTTQPVVEIESEQIKVEMETTLPRIQIDQSQCFSESGLKGILELIKDEARQASNTMYQSIGRIAEQGTQLTNIHEGGNPIAEQAYYNAYDQFLGEFNMVTMPRSRPKITLIEGKINVRETGGTVKFNPRLGGTTIDYTAGKVELYMLQEQRFNMRFHETSLDLKV